MKMKVIINQKQIENNFMHVAIENEEWVQLYPSNKQIISYLKYVKKYGSIDGTDPEGSPDNYYFNYIKFLKSFDENAMYNKAINYVLHDCYLEFDFPNEEIAFYFKMKFC